MKEETKSRRDIKDIHLTTYLNDHLAGSVAGIELAKRCRSSNRDSELGTFLDKVVSVLKDGQDKLRELLAAFGGTESYVKQLGAWTVEKVSRLKLNDSILTYSDLSRLIELETLMVAMHAQVRMWKVLDAARSGDPRLAGIDFLRIREQVEGLLEKIEEYHLQAGKIAVGKPE
ncbi:MAG: hypothetical protein ACLGPL_04380 [Acidobacteriota bacterium]